MNILFVAAEVVPFSKTGGLADVAGALPLALGKLGHDVLIATPQYRDQAGQRLVRLSDRVRVIFIEHPGYFFRDGIYGTVDPKRGYQDHPDNAARFSFLCHEALGEARKLNFRPDIVHSHDWHTGPVSMILKTLYAKDAFFKKTRTVFSIHNLAYQGLFPASKWKDLRVGPAPKAFKKCEFWGKVSYIKAGIECADAVNAVSPGYAREILTKELGCGLDHVLRRRGSAFSGILNGIDTAAWDPSTDRALPKPYSAVRPGARASSRTALLHAFGLTDRAGAPAVPIFGIVSRLAEQKGFDILMEAFDGLMERGVKFALLGTGEKRYEEFFKKAQKRYPRQASCVLSFSGAQASLIYAGSDFFLMPSRFEPCGLGQLISFRYGAVPIVHRTGGLGDTVTDVTAGPRRGNGIVFDGYSAKSLLEAADRAITLFGDKAAMEQVRAVGMKADFSWKRSAKKYVALYKKVLGC